MTAPAPFSRRPSANIPEEPGKERCGLCGKLVDVTVEHLRAVVIDGGAAWGTEESTEDRGYMGTFAIGADCARVLRRGGVALYIDSGAIR